MPHERTYSLTSRVLAYVAGVERGKVRASAAYCCGRLKRRGWGLDQCSLLSCFQNIQTAISRRVVGKSAPDNPKGIVGGFDLTVVQRNLKEWQERLWTYVCESTATVSGTVY